MDENNNQFYSNENQFNQSLPDQGYGINLSITSLKGITGWATFRAVMDIIVGALACLGIITAAYGVPQIIAGVRLLNAVDEIKRYMATNDTLKIQETFNSLNKYFKLSGISTIIKIVLSILLFIAYIVFIVVLVSNMGEFPGFPGPEFEY